LSRRGAQSGLTLFEVIVVLGIVGLMALAVTLIVDRGGRALASDSARLAAAMRSSFNRAAVSGKHHRVVIDLDEGTFHLERCEGRIRLRRSLEEAQLEDQDQLVAQLQALVDQATGQAQGGLLGPSEPLGPPPAAAEQVGEASCTPVHWDPVDPKGRGPSRLGARVQVSRVLVGHRQDPVERGSVGVNFFALGRAERAVVELATREDPPRRMSLVVHPITGRVEVVRGQVDRPDELVHRDGAGREVAR
jgi:prepilin-type N-terminal cleavage/methylation domain-containing protein